MKRVVQEPTERDEQGPRGEKVYAHPAFAQIQASRVSGSMNLFGSDFRHQHYVKLTIRACTLRRSLSTDWVFAERMPYIEVALSEAQWAHFVSSLNVGTGTQCTLTHHNGEFVPELPDPSSRSEQFAAEADERMQRAKQALLNLHAAIREAGLSGAKTKALLSHVEQAARDIGPNLKFVADMFGEHMEKVVEDAKSEIDGYIHGAIRSAGLQALNDSANNILQLPTTPKENP